MYAHIGTYNEWNSQVLYLPVRVSKYRAIHRSNLYYVGKGNGSFYSLFSMTYNLLMKNRALVIPDPYIIAC